MSEIRADDDPINKRDLRADITQWRPILTLIIFVITNILVLFPFRLPLPIYNPILNIILAFMRHSRIMPRGHNAPGTRQGLNPATTFTIYHLQLNHTTAPLMGVLILAFTTTIGMDPVRKGIVGADSINPLDIIAFALTLGYIAQSIDAAGLIKYGTFALLRITNQAGYKSGRRLFLYLYAGSFVVGCLFGNDPIIQMGMLFLTYMTRYWGKMTHPKAWLYTQFAVANIASAVMVSSNTTNLVIAQAFGIGFAQYAAHEALPVAGTMIVLFPYLLYLVFRNKELHGSTDELQRFPHNTASHTRSENDGDAESGGNSTAYPSEEVDEPQLDKATAAIGVMLMLAPLIVLLALSAAAEGDANFPVFWVTLPAAVVMMSWDISRGWLWPPGRSRPICHDQALFKKNCVKLQQESKTIPFGLNLQQPLRQSETNLGTSLEQLVRHCKIEDSQTQSRRSVQSAAVLLVSNEPVSCTDAQAGSSIQTVQPGNRQILVSASSTDIVTNDVPQAKQAKQAYEDATTSNDASTCNRKTLASETENDNVLAPGPSHTNVPSPSALDRNDHMSIGDLNTHIHILASDHERNESTAPKTAGVSMSKGLNCVEDNREYDDTPQTSMIYSEHGGSKLTDQPGFKAEIALEQNGSRALQGNKTRPATTKHFGEMTLVSMAAAIMPWFRHTFPYVAAIIPHLPYSLIPFFIPTFILVQALVDTGWVWVLAFGWDRWVARTGSVGAIGGMGFMSAILVNIAGTSIGATVLLCRVMQTWYEIHELDDTFITQREYRATAFAMALGVNYGAFSASPSATLAGHFWRQDLIKKRIHMSRLEFARVNLPLIAIAMTVGCAIIVGEVYLMEAETPVM